MAYDLSTLTPGSKVIVKGRYNTSVQTVVRLTPTGRCVIGNCSVQYHRNGKAVSQDSTSYLLPWSEEAEAQMLADKRAKEMWQVFVTETDTFIYGHRGGRSAEKVDQTVLLAAIDAIRALKVAYAVASKG